MKQRPIAQFYCTYYQNRLRPTHIFILQFNIKFNSHMHRQFSFKNSQQLLHQDENTQPPARHDRSKNDWTDQRVQEIMKKYQTPINKLSNNQKATPTSAYIPSRSPLSQTTNNSIYDNVKERTPTKNTWKEDSSSLFAKDQPQPIDYQRYRKTQNLTEGYQAVVIRDTSNNERYKPNEYSRQIQKQYENKDSKRQSYTKYSPYSRQQKGRDRQIIKNSFNKCDLINFSGGNSLQLKDLTQDEYPRSSTYNISTLDYNQSDNSYIKGEYKREERFYLNDNSRDRTSILNNKRVSQNYRKQSFKNQQDNYIVPSRKESNRIVTEGYERQSYGKYEKNKEYINQSVIETSLSGNKASKKIEYDARVNNIDRINQKIKKILSSTVEANQFPRQGKSADIARSKPTVSPYRFTKQTVQNNINTTLQLTHSNNTKLVNAKNEPSQLKTPQKSLKVNDTYKQYHTPSKRSQNIAVAQPRQSSQICQEQKQSLGSQKKVGQQLNELRSKSFVGRNEKQMNKMNTPNANKQQKSQRIQDQITQFNNKIAALNEEKRKLNINFSNYQVSRNINESIHVQGQPQNHQISSKKQQIHSQQLKKQPTPIRMMSLVDNLVETNRSEEQSNSQQLETPQSLIVHDHLNLIEESFCQPDFKIQNGTSRTHEVHLPQKYNHKMQQSTSLIDNEELRHRIADRIQDRRKKLQSISDEMDTQKIKETKKLLKLLTEQAKLDEQFRLTKNWFVNSQIPNKYSQLQQILTQRWRQMSIEQVQEQFQVNFQQDDPFYSYREEQYKLQDLVNNYVICNRHWQEHIINCWDVQQIVKQQKFIQKLDLDSKGYITIQDLVRVINMEEGEFFRNRDLYLVYKRILSRTGGDSQQLRPDMLCSALSKK